MNLDELRADCSKKQKKGLHFILASIIIWTLIFIVQIADLPILDKNFYTFCITAPLLPLAYVISKFIKVDFTNKSNPLTKLGILFSLNQMLYLLIAMWIYPTIPGKMLMVLAMIFGAHLLPFGWLYQSQSYTIMAILIPITMLVIGNVYNGSIVALVMIIFEIIFSVLLYMEINLLKDKRGESYLK
ncbi:MAG: hypothetical protein PHQ32_06660 [Firmicutes bacterium]|nr:hypothetical protein [Bacillota bacterium]